MPLEFAALARSVLDGWFERHPEAATEAGDHRYDGRLDDMSEAAQDDEVRWLADQRSALDAIDDDELGTDDLVDTEILRNRLDARLFGLERTRDASWDPLAYNPGAALWALLARDFAPLPERLAHLTERLAAVPDRLATAQRRLGADRHAVPRVHAETAVTQIEGTLDLVRGEVARAFGAAAPPVVAAATAALERHEAWLTDLVPDAVGDPRLGAERYAAKLWLTLDTDRSADVVLAAARDHLERVEDAIAEAAAACAAEAGLARGNGVREVLDHLAADHPDDATILPRAEQALARCVEAVRETDFVSIPDDSIRLITMPEFARGVAVAYCDPPGPLETGGETFYAISPTPADWPPERVASFYREYNNHALMNLSVHEGVPGHALQLAHARRHRAGTDVRRVFWSGPFVEGWAVYTEQAMVERGLGGLPVRMQQLKMALRMTINAILDAEVHAGGMTEAAAMELMVRRGHQEEGEAAGKWRRALLTSTQLSTYFVGYDETSAVIRDLAARRTAGDRAVHDAVLAHGSPPPRHLRRLLDLA